jgi:hypothetical protein
MTIAQILAQADALTPNAYTTAEKLRWLSEAESFIVNDILKPHGEQAAFSGYDAATDTDKKVLLGAPYDVLYRYYIEMQIHYADDEMTRANNARAQWNNAFAACQNYYSRSSRAPERVRALRLC